MPLVTALVDTYNHERFIEEAIVSVLEQDLPRSDMEILVVDDGSTDRTPEIVRKFEPNVRLLHKTNGGQASAINFGIAHSTGNLIAFLDGDDVWLPNKLSRVVKEFERNPASVLVYHQFCYWDSRSGEIWDSGWGQVSGDILADRRKLLAYAAAPTSSLAFRREILERLAPVPEECSFMHDSFLITTAIFLGPVVAIPECLTKNRVHGENLWFSERGEPNPDVLRRRIKVRRAAMTSVRKWVRVNASRPSRSRIRVFLQLWQLGQDADEFGINAPGRFGYFMHRCRFNLVYGWAMTRAHLAYNWTHAFVELIVGREHSHYLEGVRARVKRLLQYVERRFHSANQGDHPA
jgi:hypothetical protein